jgi:hypothetical protein
MKKARNYDAVAIMRTIRDRMSTEMKGMTPRQRIEYIRRKSGVTRRRVRSPAHTGA